MKRIIAFGLVLMLALVVGPPALAAVPPSEGIIGESGELLSDVVRMAGSGDFLLENGGTDAAAFRMPQGVLAFSDGSVLITADSRNHLIRRVANGRVETFAGFELLPEDDAGLPEDSRSMGRGRRLYSTNQPGKPPMWKATFMSPMRAITRSASFTPTAR